MVFPQSHENQFLVFASAKHRAEDTPLQASSERELCPTNEMKSRLASQRAAYSSYPALI